MTVTFANADKVGSYGEGGTANNYKFLIAVTSGKLRKEVIITAEVKAPPLSLSEGWNLSEKSGKKSSKGYDASVIRNFCYNDGKLYCVYNHSDIKVIDAQTGTDLGNLNKGEVVTGGTLTLCDVKAINGHILACNLAASEKGRNSAFTNGLRTTLCPSWYLRPETSRAQAVWATVWKS